MILQINNKMICAIVNICFVSVVSNDFSFQFLCGFVY